MIPGNCQMNGSCQPLALIEQVSGIELIFLTGTSVILVIPLWFICKKAGYSPWISLLAFFPPLGHFGLLVFLALTEWPILRGEED